MTKTGECIYCGQTAVIAVDKNMTERDINIQATIQCECDESGPYGERAESIIKAKKDVEKMFPAMKDTELILKSALEHFEYGNINAVTVTQGKVKAKLSLTKNNEIKVDRVETNKESKTY